MKYNYNHIKQEDISIDHMIDSALIEPQRVAHSYLYIDFGGELVDIHGNSIRAVGSSVSGNISITADNLLRLSLSKHGMPSNSSEVIKIRKGNEEVKFAGGVTYSDIDASFTDWIGADIENFISAWDGLRYNPVSGMVNPASVYKKYGTIVQYSPDGAILRTWKLMGCWINEVNYGDYDRGDAGGHREISLKIHIDKAYPEIRQH